MGVGKVIKKTRIRKGLSQEDLAEKAGVSSGTVADIEIKDRTPRLETLDKIAGALGTTSEHILRDAGLLAPLEEESEITALALRIKELNKRDRRIVHRLVDQLLEEEGKYDV
jgi:transcriptional regulator with XRE-family HTH domain